MKRQFFDLKVGDTLAIGESRVTLEAKSGQRARLRIESDEPTHRSESLPHPHSTPPASILKRPG
jgi:hypothetical protein